MITVSSFGKKVRYMDPLHTFSAKGGDMCQSFRVSPLRQLLLEYHWLDDFRLRNKGEKLPALEIELLDKLRT
jgi:hypothetical protein